MTDEQKDLSLSDDDAENVVGGKKVAKKQHAAPAHKTAAPNAIIVNAPPSAGGDVISHPSTDTADDADC